MMRNKILKINIFFGGLLLGGLLSICFFYVSSIDNCDKKFCYVKECVKYDMAIEKEIENSYNSRTDEYDTDLNSCNKYDYVKIRRKEYLLKESIRWAFLGISGIGIFLGIILLSIYNKKID